MLTRRLNCCYQPADQSVTFRAAYCCPFYCELAYRLRSVIPLLWRYERRWAGQNIMNKFGHAILFVDLIFQLSRTEFDWICW